MLTMLDYKKPKKESYGRDYNLAFFQPDFLGAFVMLEVKTSNCFDSKFFLVQNSPYFMNDQVRHY